MVEKLLDGSNSGSEFREPKELGWKITTGRKKSREENRQIKKKEGEKIKNKNSLETG